MQTNAKAASTEPRLQTLSRADFWQQHVRQWRDSGLSKTAYSRQYALAYHQMVYWCGKEEKVVEESTPPTKDFVAVSMAPTLGTSGVSILLPNGVSINGIDEQSIAWVGRLIEQL